MDFPAPRIAPDNSTIAAVLLCYCLMIHVHCELECHGSNPLDLKRHITRDGASEKIVPGDITVKGKPVSFAFTYTTEV